MTIRLRLTLLYGGVFLASGVVLLLLTYLLVAGADFWQGISPPEPPEPIGGLTVPAVDPGGIAARRAEDLRRLLVAEGIALAVMTVVSAGLGRLVAGRALRPLRVMTGTARAISEHSLGKRLDVRGPDDEIKELADTFDGLLGRLEGAFEAQRRFVANASHELRTPLTLERSLIEVALADPAASAAELRHTCERVLAGNQHQERLIEALLTLARSQRGLDRRAEVDLAELVPADGVGRDLWPARTAGDRALLERLVANLVDNAVRHNRPGGWARVWTGERDGRPALRVINTGPVVESGQIDEFFEPFRKGDSDGLGIGLSIVAAIVAAHGGAIAATPWPGGGLDVLVTFRPALVD